MSELLIVGSEQDNTRLDRFLADQYEEYTRSFLQKNDPDEYCPAHFLQLEVHSCFFPAFPDGFKNEKSSS